MSDENVIRIVSDVGLQNTHTMHNLFPTPVMFDRFYRDFTEEETEFINSLEQRPNQGNTTSAENYVLRKFPELKSISDFVEGCVNKYFRTVHAPKNEVSLYVTQSWFNYTTPGQYHHKHAHPNSFVSGVMYMNADREKDKIYFYNDGYKTLKLPPSDWNIWNSESWWFNVGTCDIVLFPSSFTHMVETVEADETRISLAFNTFLKGYIGAEEDLTGLRLD